MNEEDVDLYDTPAYQRGFRDGRSKMQEDALTVLDGPKCRGVWTAQDAPILGPAWAQAIEFAKAAIRSIPIDTPDDPLESKMIENPNDLRNAIVAVLLGIVLLVIVCAWLTRPADASPPPIPDIYQCEDVRGCTAWVCPPDSTRRKVMFRKGDVISTGAGMMPIHTERRNKRTGEMESWWGWNKLREDD